MGQPTGKAIVTFSDEKASEKAINIFDDKAVDNIINRVKPFFDKKGESQRK